MGNYRSLKKRFEHLAEAMADKSGTVYAAARKFVDMIDLDRDRFAELPENEVPFWLVNMAVVELTAPGAAPGPGLLVYSPLPLDREGRLKAALDALGPVRVVVAPHDFHTAGLPSFRGAYPDALFICPKAGRMTGGKSLSEMRPELEFHGVLDDEASIDKHPDLAALIFNDFAVEIMNDAAINEIVLYHEPSRTLINADFVYKAPAFESVAGLGGPEQQYIGPDWFIAAYQVLNLDPSPSKLLPDNRAFLAKHRSFDRAGFISSLNRVLAWRIDRMICSHTDPLEGAQAREAILESWQWLMDA